MKMLVMLWAIVLFTVQEANGQMARGVVQDADTREPLPFATVGFEGSSIGTITNQEGYFELLVPEKLMGHSIQVSYLGYASVQLGAEAFQSKDIPFVLLQPSVLTLKELVFRPLSPEDYIKRVVRNMKETMPKEPFNSVGYYREKLLENQAYLAFSEGVFKSYHPKYQDTIPNQHQLMLYETADNPQEVQFMKSTFAKKADRKRRKAEKKGETFDEDEGSRMIQHSFSGPDEILSMDLNRELEPFLDSTFFKKFKYHFADPVSYQGRELLVIGFESKGTVEHLKSKGKIYIDLKSDAFASIEYQADIVIPFIVQPVLLAVGLGIKDPQITKKLRYQYLDGSWYPEYFHIDMDIELVKRHFLEKNEKALFELEQVLKVSDITNTSPAPIPVEKQLDPEKDPEEQIFNDGEASWEDFNKLSEPSGMTTLN